MKIFAIVPVRNWEAGLRGELESFGDVEWFDPIQEGFNQYSKEHSSQTFASKILDKMGGVHYDLCFTYLASNWIDPGDLATIKSQSDVLVNINANDSIPSEFKKIRALVNVIDLNWTFNKRALPFYNNANAQAIYMPFAVSSQVHPFRWEGKDLDVSFFGTMFTYRSNFLKIFSERGFKTCFGSGVSSFIRDQVSRVSKTHLVLHGLPVENFADVSMKQSKLRLFECAEFSAAPLCDYYEGLEDLFDLNIDLLCFKDEKELARLLKILSNDEEYVRQVASNFYQSVYERHTWRHRFQELFKRIDPGLIEEGHT